MLSPLLGPPYPAEGTGAPHLREEERQDEHAREGTHEGRGDGYGGPCAQGVQQPVREGSRAPAQAVDRRVQVEGEAVCRG